MSGWRERAALLRDDPAPTVANTRPIGTIAAFGRGGEASEPPIADAEDEAMATHYAAPADPHAYRPDDADELRDGLGIAAAVRPPAWADSAALPSLGSRCSCCNGQLWWKEAITPQGWRCVTCHPAPPGLVTVECSTCHPAPESNLVAGQMPCLIHPLPASRLIAGCAAPGGRVVNHRLSNGEERGTGILFASGDPTRLRIA